MTERDPQAASWRSVAAGSGFATIGTVLAGAIITGVLTGTLTLAPSSPRCPSPPPPTPARTIPPSPDLLDLRSAMVAKPPSAAGAAGSGSATAADGLQFIPPHP